MSSASHHRRPKSIRSEAPSAFTDPTSTFTLSARTRSMTRLGCAIVDTTSTSSFEKLDQSTTSRKQNHLKSSAKRQPLMSKTVNVHAEQTGLGERLMKRSTTVDTSRPKKMLRVHEEPRLTTQHQSNEPPRTPLRNVSNPNDADHGAPPAVVPIAQPTPARLLLSAHKPPQADDDDSSPEGSPAFVARPPTPPRPHSRLSPVDNGAQSRSTKRALSPDNTVDQDSRPSKMRIREAAPSSMPSTTIPKMSTAPPPSAFSRSQAKMSLIGPATPVSTKPTPKRVMASVSRFRTAPSPRIGITSNTTLKAPVDPGTSTTAQEPSEGQPLMARGTMSRSTAKFALFKTELAAKEPNVDKDLPQPQAAANEPTEAESNVEPAATVEEEDSSLTLVTTATTQPAPSAMPTPSRIPYAIRSSRPSMAPLPRPAKMDAVVPVATAAHVASVQKPLLASAIPVPVGSNPSTSLLPLPSAAAVSISVLGKGLPSAAPVNVTEPATRKPSYPFNLGSGPMTRPRHRMVSGPVLNRRDLAAMVEQPDRVNTAPRVETSPRSVSAPAPRPRPSLNNSTSRREGLSMETSKHIAGLSNALSRLKTRRPESVSEPNRPRPNLSGSISRIGLGHPSQAISTTSALPPPASTRITLVHRPRHSLITPSIGDASLSSIKVSDSVPTADGSLAALMSSTSGGGCFKGVVAFVDVRTAEGDDASSIFGEMLKSLGARVISRLTDNVTHVIYKSGKPATLTWWRRQDEESRPHVVGIKWVTKSKEKGEKLNEESFLVDVGEEDVFQKRRRSMEPKALFGSTGPGSRSVVLDSSLNIASVRRQSMLYAPKISSPLKKAY